LPNGFVITYDKYNDIIVTSMEWLIYEK
jgi:hypothetical protein